MRTFIFYFFLIFSVPFTALNAQVRTVSNIQFEESSMHAQHVNLQASEDKAVDIWIEFWDERYDVKLEREANNRKRQIFKAYQVKVSDISDKQLDIYSKVVPKGDQQTVIYMGIGFGYEVYAGPDRFPEAYQATEGVMGAFENYFYNALYGNQVAELEDKLEDIKDEKKDLQRDLEKEQKRIDKWKSKIEKYQERIDESQSEKGQLAEMINTQDGKIFTIEKQLQKVRSRLQEWQ